MMLIVHDEQRHERLQQVCGDLFGERVCVTRRTCHDRVTGRRTFVRRHARAVLVARHSLFAPAHAPRRSGQGCGRPSKAKMSSSWQEEALQPAQLIVPQEQHVATAQEVPAPPRSKMVR